MKTETKSGILLIVAVIVILILLQGTEIGTFYKTGDAMYHLWALYYLITAVAVFAYFVGYKKLFKDDTRLQMVKNSLLLLFLCTIPSLLLFGVTGYVDYYTTNKQWKTVEVSVGDKISHSSIGTNSSYHYYSYKLVGKDTVLYLDSRVSFKDFETFYINICTTRLGNVVAYRNYPQKK